MSRLRARADRAVIPGIEPSFRVVCNSNPLGPRLTPAATRSNGVARWKVSRPRKASWPLRLRTAAVRPSNFQNAPATVRSYGVGRGLVTPLSRSEGGSSLFCARAAAGFERNGQQQQQKEIEQPGTL